MFLAVRGKAVRQSSAHNSHSIKEGFGIYISIPVKTANLAKRGVNHTVPEFSLPVIPKR